MFYTNLEAKKTTQPPHDKQSQFDKRMKHDSCIWFSAYKF